MSYTVATMKKLKMSDLGGIQVELDRQYADENAYKNDVDLTKSDQNVELVATHENQKGALRKDVKNYIDENKSSSRKTRKDAVVLNSWVITSDNQFFENLDRPQTIQFFQDAKDFFGERYGQDNIRQATIHFDETTPHMHLGIVPLHDGKLSSKTLLTPVELQNLQSDFPDYMQQHGWDIERGVKGSERKHLDAPEYREATEKAKKLAETNKQLETEIKNQAIDTISSINPNAKVTDDVYTQKRDEAIKNGQSRYSFWDKFGFKPEKISTDFGRKQFFEWISVDHLKDHAVKLVNQLKDKVLEYRDNIKNLRSENKQLSADIKQQKQEYKQFKQASGQETTDYLNSASDFFSSYVDKANSDQQKKAQQQQAKQQTRRSQSPRQQDFGGRSR